MKHTHVACQSSAHRSQVCKVNIYFNLLLSSVDAAFSLWGAAACQSPLPVITGSHGQPCLKALK